MHRVGRLPGARDPSLAPDLAGSTLQRRRDAGQRRYPSLGIGVFAGGSEVADSTESGATGTIHGTLSKVAEGGREP
jgi:hypothetical protein